MIPVVEDFRSSPMTHRLGDLFNPPALTNFIGCVQADVDPVAIRALSFPPFATGDAVSASVYIDNVIFPATGSAVTFIWQPDRIERVADFNGVRIASTTSLIMGQMAAVVRVTLENRSQQARDVSLRLGLRGGITKQVAVWANAHMPGETPNQVAIDTDRKALCFTSTQSQAVWLQGTNPLPNEIRGTLLAFAFHLRPGESKTLDYISVVGETKSAAAQTYDAIIQRVAEEIGRTRDEWNRELAAVFTPGNERYSGHMPTLETSDRDVLKLYHTGILGVIMFKRDSAYSVHGRAYTTLMPRYWMPVTFLWDYSLSSLVHALLDPAVMKNYLKRWIQLDIHKHFGTEYLTGGSVGPWYAVNDYGMSVIARDYLRFNGDHPWLNENINDHPVAHYLESFATNYKQFLTPSGLADYGGLNNLLECVSTYIHEVASLNAANVFNLRFAAELADMRHDTEAAARFRDQAAVVIPKVQSLYARGKGFFHTRFPDGSLHEVRHIYDFITVLNTLADDLPANQKREMVDFFRRELQTPTWLHALSPADDDGMFSVRPDHQWAGSYPAWPPQAVTALYRIGQGDLAFDWLKGLAQSANQGPFGQAHFAESVVPPEAGGARKVPPEFPYINDWTCSSNGSWCNIIIESIFGVQAPLKGELSAFPQFGKFDRDSVLRNLRYQGKSYDITRSGARIAK